MTVVKEIKTLPEVGYYVFARNGKVASAVNVVGTNQVNIKVSKGVDLDASTNTLVLEEINRIMEAILEKTKDGSCFVGTPIRIRTINSLVNTINTGNFKYWVKLGKYANGVEVPSRDIKAWGKFIKLYGQLFGDINFNKQSIAKKFHNKDNLVDRAIIAKLWDQLPTEIEDFQQLDDKIDNIVF